MPKKLKLANTSSLKMQKSRFKMQNFGIVRGFVGKRLSGKKAFIALGLTAELVGLRFCW